MKGKHHSDNDEVQSPT